MNKFLEVNFAEKVLRFLITLKILLTISTTY